MLCTGPNFCYDMGIIGHYQSNFCYDMETHAHYALAIWRLKHLQRIGDYIIVYLRHDLNPIRYTNRDCRKSMLSSVFTQRGGVVV